MATALAKTSNEAAWLDRAEKAAPKTFALRRRAREALSRMPLALPLTPWSMEMAARLEGLIPAFDYHLWHARELDAEFLREAEETVRNAEVIES